MPLEKAIEQSRRWMTEVATLVNGTTFETTTRSRVSVSLQHLCIEHHTGIHTLVDHGVLGSAFALFRPQFEAYVRGAWYQLCAAEDELAGFLRGSQPPRIDTLIDQLERKGAFAEGNLRRMKSETWRNLCDFTHGGAIQVKARNTRDEVVRNYKIEHVAGLLTASATLALLAGTAIAAAVDSDSLAVNLQTAYRSIYETAA
jgi:hypothetical protein